MVTRRTAKTKGNQFEYDVWASLKQFFPNIKLAKEMGYQQQFDLINEEPYFLVECKRHKTISWNQAKAWFEKVEYELTSSVGEAFLIFKSNQQPVLVMYRDETKYCLNTTEFEDYFGVPFIKHKPFNKK